MTQLLEQTMTKVQGLPTEEQDASASLILDELADEAQWNQAFARSQDQLAKLAAKVRDDIQAGRVRDVGRSRPLTSDGRARCPSYSDL